MKVEKNTATKPARVSPKMSSTNRFHSTAAKLPDRRSFPQWQFYEIQENPCARMTILWNKRRTNVDFWSKCWFGADVGDGHFYRESLCENDNSMKQETHKCRFFFQMLIWRWRWRCGSVKENPCARMRIPCQVLIKKVAFSSKMLIFHWKNVGLGPKRVFYITFSGEKGWFWEKMTIFIWKYV